MNDANARNQYPGFYKQLGIGMNGWIAIILAAVVIGKFVIGVGPAIYENYTLKQSLKGLAETPGLSEMGKEKLSSNLSKLMNVNNIRDIPADAITYERGKNNVWKINADYQVESEFFGPVFLVTKFRNQLDTSKPDECCSWPDDAK